MKEKFQKTIDSTIDKAKPIIDKIGEPFKYKIVETGFHGTCVWKLDNTGHLYIYPQNGISGKLADCTGFTPNTKWLHYAQNIYYVTVEQGVLANKSAAFLFSGLYNCKIINAEKLNVSETKIFTCMFDGCKNLKKVDIRGWKTGNATDMGGMFHGCSKLEWVSGDLKNLDTSKVKNMSGMFFDCHSLESLNLNSFNLENVCNMSNMFAYCTKLRTLKFKALDQGTIPSYCETKDMFKSCWKLKKYKVNKLKSQPFHFPSFKDIDWELLKYRAKKEFDASWLFKKMKKLKNKPSTTP